MASLIFLNRFSNAQIFSVFQQLVANYIQMESDAISQKEILLEWASKLLNVKISKVSQLSNGAIFLRLYDLAFPKRINQSRVIWKAVTEAESLMNLKMLSEELKKAKKQIHIQRINRSNNQQCLELLSWFKKQLQAIPPKTKTIEFSESIQVNQIPSQKPISKQIKEPGVVRSILKKGDATLSILKKEYDQKKVQEIEDFLQKEKQLKASDKIEKIKTIIFRKSPNSQIKKQIKGLQNIPNTSNINVQVSKLKVQVKEERRKSPIGRESLLINLPLNVEERVDLRKSQNLLDCGLDPT